MVPGDQRPIPETNMDIDMDLDLGPEPGPAPEVEPIQTVSTMIWRVGNHWSYMILICRPIGSNRIIQHTKALSIRSRRRRFSRKSTFAASTN